jgi:hypothetical protein
MLPGLLQLPQFSFNECVQGFVHARPGLAEGRPAVPEGSFFGVDVVGKKLGRVDVQGYGKGLDDGRRREAGGGFEHANIMGRNARSGRQISLGEAPGSTEFLEVFRKNVGYISHASSLNTSFNDITAILEFGA